MTELPNRCTSMAPIPLPDGGVQDKRCTRAADHHASELHLWVEAWTRVDGDPIIVKWADDLVPVVRLAVRPS